MKKKLLSIVIVLLFCFGCNAATGASPLPSASPQASPAVSAQASGMNQTPKAGAVSVTLPLPSSELYGLVGSDALLFDIAVDNFCARGLVSDLLLPSFAILDSYPADGGDTYYICKLKVHEYHNLGFGLDNLDNPEYIYSSPSANYARFKVSKDGDDKLVCTEILQSLNGDTRSWQASVDSICGPKKELAKAIQEFYVLPVQPRYLTPSDPTQLLSKYLGYNFKNTQAKNASVKLPFPSSKLYGLTGIDAVLYDAANEVACARQEKYNKHTGSLGLITLAVYDSYQKEDGSTCYICKIGEGDYYNLSLGLADLSYPKYNYGGGGYLARLTISKMDDGTLFCSEVFTGYDGPGWAKGISLICGPKTELAEAIIKNQSLPVTPRKVVVYKEEEMLNFYLDYYFRGK